jgi:hypothetical protein
VHIESICKGTNSIQDLQPDLAVGWCVDPSGPADLFQNACSQRLQLFSSPSFILLHFNSRAVCASSVASREMEAELAALRESVVGILCSFVCIISTLFFFLTPRPSVAFAVDFVL